ncbi:MAG: 23S rRNA (uracil(1939)-C(5))-methyltransferase RlmD, partial [Saprospiraceae bacterium]
LLYVINQKVNDIILDQEIELFHGPGFIYEMLGHVRFKIGPKSFFQTNTEQGIVLYDLAKEFADLQGHENVYDLYTGLGSIALYLADQCKQITGIEEIAAAIDDANENAALNNIENATFYAGDVRDILNADFIAKHGKPDVVITDPPRAGMHPDVVNILIELNAPKIVYVSCNAATQARDIALMQDSYQMVRSQAVDMFPQTDHVENVALLVRKDLLNTNVETE